METVISALCVNERDEVLLLRRAPTKEHFPNRWDTVAGKVEPGEHVEEALQRELREEIGINSFTILKRVDPVVYNYGEDSWLVHLFFCRIPTTTIILNEEHTALPLGHARGHPHPRMLGTIQTRTRPPLLRTLPAHALNPPLPPTSTWQRANQNF